MRPRPHFNVNSMIKLDNSIGKNFCYAPWTNIHINPQGSYKTCCAGEVALADLRITPIQDVIKSSQILHIKQAIVENKTHTNCSICERQEQMTSTSERNWYDDISERKTINLDTIQDQHLQNLDIRWSNTCNLSCTYCGPEASSIWASHRKIPLERLDYSNTMPGIIAFIESNRSTLKNLGLLGGEPLLQKENDQLLDAIGPDVHINLITNLSVPLENNQIFKKLLDKNRVVWDISFDTVEQKFEYVRHGASWDLLLKNIRHLQDAVKDRPGHSIGVASVYSVYNALNLSQVHEYFADNKLPNMRWNELNNPVVLSVINLPKQFRDQAVQELEKSIPYHKWHRQKTFLQEMANSIKNITANKDNCDDLYNWHFEQEQTYWSNFKYKFADLWPEYRA